MRSMTGYGTAEGRVGKGVLYLEIKSINHRFSEFNLKIPPKMGAVEGPIREFLKERFARGKVDLYLREKEPLFGHAHVAIDMDLAKAYHNALKKIHRDLKLSEDLEFLEVVGLDRIVRVDEPRGAYDALLPAIRALLERACRHVVAMQQREGAHIAADQKARITAIRGLVRTIRKQTARVMDQHYTRVRKKVKGNSGGDTDAGEQRVHMEVSLLGARQDITEELTRLDSHANQYSTIVRLKEPVGRRLDFLLQEMNREANTIGAKAADAQISQCVVELKSEIERLKEQIQNIE